MFNSGFGSRGGGGNMQSNFNPSDGLRNPERPQLESIYRGKVVWGNVSSDNIKDEMHQTLNDPNDEFDKFGNPIIRSAEIKRRPKPRVQPKRKEDVDEAKTRIKRADVKEVIGGDEKFEMPTVIEYARLTTLNTETVTFSNVQKEEINEFNKNQKEYNKFVEDNLDLSLNSFLKKAKDEKIVQKRDVENVCKAIEKGEEGLEKQSIKIQNDKDTHPHNIVKREIESIYKNSPIQSRYTGSPIESRYKNLIKSQYKGPVIESIYKGPLIRSEYKVPEMRAEYLKQKHSPQHEYELGHRQKGFFYYRVGDVTQVCENLADKYNKMNIDNNMVNEDVPQYVKRKAQPRLADDN